MKLKNKAMSVVLLTSIFVSPMAMYAASQSLDSGNATWYGGIYNDLVYSKLWDHVVDGRRYQVTVWVADDTGDRDELTGKTTDVDAAGQVKITKPATYKYKIFPNRAGYKDFVVLPERTLFLDDGTPTELEAEFWDTEFEVELWDEQN